MKNHSKPKNKPVLTKRTAKLKRLTELANRLHGSMPNFMTQEDLKGMREDAKWEAPE